MRGVLIFFVSAASCLSACATTPKSCRATPHADLAAHSLPNGRGIVLASRFDDASIPELSCAADQGLQAAQVALAKRYETGDGTARDLARAVALYEQAASSIPPTTPIYSPPVRLGGQGRVLFLNNPNAGPSSAEAQYRLGRLLIEGRGVRQDLERGRRLIEQAAKQGYSPAGRPPPPGS